MSVLSRIRLAIVSGFGIGWLPASGTITSAIVAVLLWKFPTFRDNLFMVHGASLVLPPVLVITILCGILISTTEEEFRRRITIDHVFGMVLAFAFVPSSPKMVLMAFAIYRFYDVIKPWPIHYLTDMKSGVGSFLDDLLSGLLTAVTLYAIKLAYGELMSYL